VEQWANRSANWSHISLKRPMFGRAGFDLLSQRVVQCA
jgi:hypothetical protein